MSKVYAEWPSGTLLVHLLETLVQGMSYLATLYFTAVFVPIENFIVTYPRPYI